MMPLRRLDPIVKLAVAIVWMIVATVVFDPVVMAGAALVPALALLLLDRARPLHLLLVAIPFAMVGFGYLWFHLAFRVDEGGLTGVEAWSSGAPAAEAGLTLFLRTLAFGFISYAFVRTTDPGRLVHGLMQRLGLRPTLGFSLFAGLQQLPALARDARQIALAQAMRRGRAPPRLPGPVTLARIGVPLLAAAVRRAADAAIAMETRGLAPGLARTTRHRLRLGPGDAVFAVVALGLLAGLVALR